MALGANGREPKRWCEEDRSRAEAGEAAAAAAAAAALGFGCCSQWRRAEAEPRCVGECGLGECGLGEYGEGGGCCCAPPGERGASGERGGE